MSLPNPLPERVQSALRALADCDAEDVSTYRMSDRAVLDDWFETIMVSAGSLARHCEFLEDSLSIRSTVLLGMAALWPETQSDVVREGAKAMTDAELRRVLLAGTALWTISDEISAATDIPHWEDVRHRLSLRSDPEAARASVDELRRHPAAAFRFRVFLRLKGLTGFIDRTSADEPPWVSDALHGFARDADPLIAELAAKLINSRRRMSRPTLSDQEIEAGTEAASVIFQGSLSSAKNARHEGGDYLEWEIFELPAINQTESALVGVSWTGGNNGSLRVVIGGCLRLEPGLLLEVIWLTRTRHAIGKAAARGRSSPLLIVRTDDAADPPSPGDILEIRLTRAGAVVAMAVVPLGDTPPKSSNA